MQMSKGIVLALLGMTLLASAAYPQSDVQTPRWSGMPDGESPAQASRSLRPVARPQTKEVETSEVSKINAWTVGLAAGQREGAPLEFATDISRVADDGDNLHVLPIVTRGPTENVADLLYLRGVDVAIINSDSLEQFRIKIPDIQQRITYILSLFPSELHILVRPEVKSLDDLKGRKVNFNTQGTAAAYSGPLIFDKLKLTEVERTFVPHQVAIEQMKSGSNDMAAVVFVTSKPVDAFLKGKWPPGFHLLSVPMEDYSFYLPATLTAADYPAFIPQGEEIQTIAIPTILAAFNWPKGSNRYARVARLVDNLFGRLELLQGPGYHPKWKDVVLNAQVPGLARFGAAQEWLDRTTAVAQADVLSTNATTTMSPTQAKLWQEFQRWRKNTHQ
jgi:TRAP-type uncharacterized transport system substrate-binding protein